MINYYHECHDFEVQDSITQIICDLFERSNNVEDGPALIEHFFIPEHFNKIT